MVIAGLAYAYRGPIQEQFGGLVANLEATFTPCQKPIAYSLGTFDTRFGISKESFLRAVADAEAIWEKPIGKNLFQYSSDGRLAVHLIYDYRQEATDKLKRLGITVDASRASYDSLKVKYYEVKSALMQSQKQYETALALYKQHLDSYNQEVESWNAKGGAPRSEFVRLSSEKQSLDAELSALKSLQDTVNGYVDEVNSIAVVLNGMANALNVDVGKYNTIGASRGEEFTEGDYQSKGGEQKIDIYEFSTQNKLVRVLAHELGHALGLEHVEGSTSIMYELNQSTNEKLSSQDLAALKSKCGIK